MDPIRIEGEIGADVTAGGVADALAEIGGPADIVVNSSGGSATEGAAIFAEIKAHPAPVTIRVRGIAASSASLLVMAGDTILMAPGSVLMLHDPAALTLGNAEVHRSAAAVLEELATIYAGIYAEASGNRASLVRDWMRAESWIAPEDAVALGFADGIEETPAPETGPALTARAAAPALHHQQPAALVAAPILTI